MTDERVSPAEASEAHDLTLALTPGQLLLVVIGVFILLRLIRRRRAA